MINYLLKKFINFFVFIVSCLVGLLFTEVIIRAIDGYPVFPITLGNKPQPKKLIMNKTQASNYLNKLYP